MRRAAKTEAAKTEGAKTEGANRGRHQRRKFTVRLTVRNTPAELAVLAVLLDGSRSRKFAPRFIPQSLVS